MTFRTVSSLILASIAAFAAPALPVALLCSALVIIDCITAIMMTRRMLAAGQKVDARLSSRRFGRTVATLVRIYIALFVASAVQIYVVDPAWGFNVLNFTGIAIVFNQTISILENESTCSHARWARKARKFLADKAKKYLEK